MNLKNFLLVATLSLAVVACAPDSDKNEKPTAENGIKNPKKTNKPDAETLQQFELKPGSAGQIKVNMPSEYLKKMVPAENLKKTERELEGEKYTTYEIRNAKTGNQLLLLAEESCLEKTCKIFRIRVISPKFKTKEGIRVGSTFGEVKKAYPISFVGLGEADFVAISEKQKMTFTLDISKFPPKELYKIKLADIPDSSAVTSILLF